jgi:hypothetical protein
MSHSCYLLDEDPSCKTYVYLHDYWAACVKVYLPLLVLPAYIPRPMYMLPATCDA